MANFLIQLLQLYAVCIFARIILSWFPITPGGVMATVFSVLWNITEPVLRPLRQIIPPIGMLDLSPLVVFFAIQILVSILRGSA